MEKSLKMRIQGWRDKVGRQKAEEILKSNGVKRGTAQKLLAGTYPNNPKFELRSSIESALKKSA